MDLFPLWNKHRIFVGKGLEKKAEINNLVKHLIFEEEKNDINKSDTVSLAGRIFVVTGKVKRFKNRDEIKELIESLGGKVTGSVTKNTSYLINNDVNSTSGKNKKAKQLGIKIISEDDFLKLINWLN